MNRKMRAKLANKQAKAKKERKPCPDRGKLLPTTAEHCDRCGGELQPVVLLKIEPGVPKEKLN